MDSCPECKNKSFHKDDNNGISRRDFIRTSAIALGSVAVSQHLLAAKQPAEPVIDIHQHILYMDRPDDVLIAHQRTMGITTSVLMPSGDRGPGHTGGSGEHEGVVALSRKYPGEYVFFANEISDKPDAPKVIEKQLKAGAIGIGEQKFHVDCDSEYIVKVAEVAREYNVPIIMHFQYGMYNMHVERFYKILEKFPTVNFVGHSMEWWAVIDKNADQSNNYPLSPVTPGGIVDRYLTDYPNCYADISAGSGYNAIIRDEDHFRAFMTRHQDKLVFGSDCSEGTGKIPWCIGARTLAVVRRIAPSKAIERKILYENSKKLLKI
jgi:predicted TIM-barrel fold metal-dependent hydrolase